MKLMAKICDQLFNQSLINDFVFSFSSKYVKMSFKQKEHASGFTFSFC